MHTGHNQELPKRGNGNEGDDRDDTAGVAEAEHKVTNRVAQDRANRSQRAQRNGNHDGQSTHGTNTVESMSGMIFFMNFSTTMSTGMDRTMGRTVQE